MQVRQIIEIFKVTTISSSSQKLFNWSPREAYFLFEDTAKEYVENHPELGMVVSRENAFERGYDDYHKNIKDSLAYNYYLFRPAEIEHTKKKDLRKSDNAWGCVLKDGIKHFIQFKPAVERAINENNGSVLILRKCGVTHAMAPNKHYFIDHYDIEGYSMQCLYVKTIDKKGKLTEVRSFIDENNMIRVNVNSPKKKLEKKEVELEASITGPSK